MLQATQQSRTPSFKFLTMKVFGLCGQKGNHNRLHMSQISRPPHNGQFH